MTRYRSEIGWPFVVVYLVLASGLGWPIVSAALAGRAVSPGLIIAAVTVLGGMACLAATTGYAITADSLIARCGPFRTVVALSAIDKLRPSGSILAAPALSSRRIEVLATPGPSLLISPADRGAFIKDLRARAPRIELEGLEGA